MSGLDALIDSLVDRPSWFQRAACRGVGPETFYPDQYRHATAALLICMGCPVRRECGDHAAVTGERFGVWGGVVRRKKKKVRKAS